MGKTHGVISLPPDGDLSAAILEALTLHALEAVSRAAGIENATPGHYWSVVLSLDKKNDILWIAPLREPDNFTNFDYADKSGIDLSSVQDAASYEAKKRRLCLAARSAASQLTGSSDTRPITVSDPEGLQRYVFIRGVPVQPDGSPMDYRGTPYQKEVAEGLFDGGAYALLTDTANGLEVVKMAQGCTDVCWLGWIPEHPDARCVLQAPTDYTKRDEGPYAEYTNGRRKEYIDAVRPFVSEELGGRDLLFVVWELQSDGDFVFLRGQPVNPDGSAFDYSGTIYQQYIEESFFDDNVQILIQRDKTNGGWKVLEMEIGCTDVCWWGWEEVQPEARGLLKDSRTL